MAARGTTRHLSDHHEQAIVDKLGGTLTRGSGSSWREKLDGRMHRLHQKFAFAWDAKATEGKSISISREMWAKTVDQADRERPAIMLRFYDPGMRVALDLAVIGIEEPDLLAI
jgi:hypothetical protein